MKQGKVGGELISIWGEMRSAKPIQPCKIISAEERRHDDWRGWGADGKVGHAAAYGANAGRTSLAGRTVGATFLNGLPFQT